MSVFLQPGAKKRVYWYRFMHRGQVIRRSTKQSNFKIAKDMESTHKSALAKGEAGLIDKPPVPTLAAFAREFIAWASAQFQAKPKTLAYYKNSINRLQEYPGLMSLAMDDSRIAERLTGYIAKRQADGLKVSSLNHELRCVRRLLRLGVERERIEAVPKIRLLSGEVHRERVITPDEETSYLAAASSLLASVAMILIDTGLRPEECYRLVWDSVTWDKGRFGAFLVTHGKTKAARRLLPMTARVRQILEDRWLAAGKPLSGWVWPASTKSGHMEPSTIKKQHRNALRVSSVRPFVLYSLRHTCLTRWGEKGMDAYLLARLAGHSSIMQSMRYVHPSGDAVLAVMENSGGPVFGHGTKTEDAERRLSA